jgi:GDP-L-fucose synthase
VRTLLTGGGGMLGRSFSDAWRALRPDSELVIATRAQCDLRDAAATAAFVGAVAPDSIVHMAAKVGGIGAKLATPVPYVLDNLRIDTNVIAAALEHCVPELLCMGSAAAYPERYVRPFVESDMLSGRLEEANAGYATAKLAAGSLCVAASRQHGVRYRVAVPSNLYGPYDRFSLADAHLVAAALAKVEQAHRTGSGNVTVWGDGTARREFTFAGDLAAWLVTQVGQLDTWPATLNVGCGKDHSVRTYYEVACQVVGFEGDLVFDTRRPSGVPRRLLDSGAARSLGWQPSTSLIDGMTQTYSALLTHPSQHDHDH